MPSPWRPARSLTQLLTQVNTACPGRAKGCDGMIGDQSHQGTTSDHNPDAAGVVRALDITNDPASGMTSDHFAKALALSRDPRIRYLISNGRICSSTVSPWTWRPYEGSNSHTAHCHVSVVAGPAGDDGRAWTLKAGPPAVACPPYPGMVRTGTRGTAVRAVQARMRARGWAVVVDGIAGPALERAVRAFQRQVEILPDGVVGPVTWHLLWAAKVTR